MPYLVLIMHYFSISYNREVETFIVVFAKNLKIKYFKVKKKSLFHLGGKGYLYS